MRYRRRLACATCGKSYRRPHPSKLEAAARLLLIACDAFGSTSPTAHPVMTGQFQVLLGMRRDGLRRELARVAAKRSKFPTLACACDEAAAPRKRQKARTAPDAPGSVSGPSPSVESENAAPGVALASPAHPVAPPPLASHEFYVPVMDAPRSYHPPFAIPAVVITQGGREHLNHMCTGDGCGRERMGFSTQRRFILRVHIERRAAELFREMLDRVPPALPTCQLPAETEAELCE